MLPRSLVAFAVPLCLLAGCASRKTGTADVGVGVGPAVHEPIAVQLPILPAAAPASIEPSRAGALESTALLSTLGRSRQGRPIVAQTMGRGSSRVYLIASIHGDEPEGASALGAVQELLVAGRHEVSVRLVHDMNPDGTSARSRGNASGVDLNRNWPASNFRGATAHGEAPLSEPESAAVLSDLTSFDPHVVVVLHSSPRGPFVNFDGPDAAALLAERFVAGAHGSGDERWKVVPSMGYPTPGSMGTYFGKDLGMPILTIELRRGETSSRVTPPLLSGVSGLLRALAEPGLGGVLAERTFGKLASDATTRSGPGVPGASTTAAGAMLVPLPARPSPQSLGQ